MLDIRFLDPDIDLIQFRKLRLTALETHPTEYLHLYSYESSTLENHHRNMLKNNKVVGVFDDTNLIAFTFLTLGQYKKHEHKCTVWGAYVNPEYRSKGLGKKMRLFLFDYAKNLELKYVVSSIMASSKASLAMHKSLGYYKTYVEKSGIKQLDGTFTDIIYFRKDL